MSGFTGERTETGWALKLDGEIVERFPLHQFNQEGINRLSESRDAVAEHRLALEGFITYDGERVIFVANQRGLEGWIESASIGKFTTVCATFLPPTNPRGRGA